MMGTLFKEANGNTSSMRVLAAFIVAAIVGTWCVLSIMTRQMLPMPADQVVMVLGALGLKVWQRGKE